MSAHSYSFATTPATRFRCPLPDCDWSHDEPTTSRDISRTGTGPITRAAERAAARALEDLLAGHVKTHPPIEWFRALIDAQRKVRDMQSRPPLTAEVSYSCTHCSTPADHGHTDDCPYNQNPPRQ